MKHDYPLELTALMSAFDFYEREAAECGLPDSNRQARRYLIEHCAAALLEICRTEDERIAVFECFAGFIKRRVAPLFAEAAAIRLRELEDALTDYCLREEGLDPPEFLQILLEDWRERGWAVCLACRLTYHDHLVAVLLARTSEERRRLHHFISEGR
jgi:hypothetical protein